MWKNILITIKSWNFAYVYVVMKAKGVGVLFKITHTFMLLKRTPMLGRAWVNVLKIVDNENTPINKLTYYAPYQHMHIKFAPDTGSFLCHSKQLTFVYIQCVQPSIPSPHRSISYYILYISVFYIYMYSIVMNINRTTVSLLASP